MDLLPKIEIDGASKTIGNSVVLDQIQLTVKPGEMIGLQGVNGSGKTMLLRLISGLIYPTKGHVLIDGKMLGSDLEFPPSIGFLIENPTFLPQYTGAENLQMLSSLHQMMPTAQIESVLQRVGLHDTKYKKYSLGMKQRLGIAAAVFEQPDIILLDEPTNNLNHLASLLGSVLGGLLCALGKLLSFLLGSSFRLHGVGGGADLLLVTVHAADSMRGSFNGVCLFFGRQSLLLCGTVIRGVCRLIYTCFFPASRCRGGMA